MAPANVPVWDMADRFGPDTNLLVTGMAQARDLAVQYLRRYGLGGFERQYPTALSGGIMLALLQ